MTNERAPLVVINLVAKPGVGLPIAWETAINGWIAWLQLGGISNTTIRLRRGHVSMVARRSRTDKPSDLTWGILQILCAQHHWSREHRKGLRTSLNSFYEWCLIRGLAEENVARCLPKVQAAQPCPRPAPDIIWRELLAAAPPRERLMALLAGEAGLRRAEVAQAHIDDLIQDMHGWSLVVRGKGGRTRVVPLTDRLAREIRGYRAAGYLFPGQIDGHISAHHVGKLISRLMPPTWSIHKLRHRYASKGLAGTGNLLAVKEALGHSSVATTQRYCAISSSEVRRVSEAAADSGVA